MSKYLYNGIELPDLPEWDKTAYPYAHLWYVTIRQKYYLRYSTTPVIGYDSEFNIQLKYASNGSYVSYEIPKAGTEWANETTATYAEGESCGYGQKIWSNHDICYEDGSVCLAASYPINAETGEEVHDYEIGGEPDPDPVPVLSWNGKDAYAVINGSWVRCDVVKPTDGKWVKQDGYTV